MKRSVKSYYLKKLTGKSVVARWADRVFLAAGVFSVAYIIAMFGYKNIFLALPLSALTAATVLCSVEICRKRKLKKYMDAELKRLSEKAAVERIMRMGGEEYAALIAGMKRELPNGSVIFFRHPDEPVTGSEVMERAMAGAGTLLSPSGFTKVAKSFAADRGIELLGAAEFIELAQRLGCGITEEERERACEREMEEHCIRPSALNSVILSKKKAPGYITAGILATLWPLIAGWNAVYPIAALCCYALAFFSYRKKEEQKEGM